MIGVASLLVALTLASLVTRVSTVALRATGLSHDVARFQARSAFWGVGFTTAESEDLVNHPVRRRIVTTPVLLSGAGIVTTLASLLLSFADTSGYPDVERDHRARRKLGAAVRRRLGRAPRNAQPA
ncbi:MAG: hypothetical protein ACRDKW_03400 [Actinomycetota bacterium]